MSEDIIISRYECYQEIKKFRESDPNVITDVDLAEKILKKKGVFFKDKPEPTDRNHRAYIQQKSQLNKEIKTVQVQKNQRKKEEKISGTFFNSRNYTDLTYVQNIASSGTGDLFQETRILKKNFVTGFAEGSLSFRRIFHFERVPNSKFSWLL